MGKEEQSKFGALIFRALLLKRDDFLRKVLAVKCIKIFMANISSLDIDIQWEHNIQATTDFLTLTPMNR